MNRIFHYFCISSLMGSALVAVEIEADAIRIFPETFGKPDTMRVKKLLAQKGVQQQLMVMVGGISDSQQDTVFFLDMNGMQQIPFDEKEHAFVYGYEDTASLALSGCLNRYSLMTDLVFRQENKKNADAFLGLENFTRSPELREAWYHLSQKKNFAGKRLFWAVNHQIQLFKRISLEEWIEENPEANPAEYYSFTIPEMAAFRQKMDKQFNITEHIPEENTLDNWRNLYRDLFFATMLILPENERLNFKESYDFFRAEKPTTFAEAYLPFFNMMVSWRFHRISKVIEEHYRNAQRYHIPFYVLVEEPYVNIIRKQLASEELANTVVDYRSIIKAWGTQQEKELLEAPRFPQPKPVVNNLNNPVSSYQRTITMKDLSTEKNEVKSASATEVMDALSKMQTTEPASTAATQENTDSTTLEEETNADAAWEKFDIIQKDPTLETTADAPSKKDNPPNKNTTQNVKPSETPNTASTTPKTEATATANINTSKPKELNTSTTQTTTAKKTEPVTKPVTQGATKTSEPKSATQNAPATTTPSTTTQTKSKVVTPNTTAKTPETPNTTTAKPQDLKTTATQVTTEKKVQTAAKPITQAETKASEPKPVTQNVTTTTSPTSPAQAKPKTITPNTATKTPEASNTTATKPKELSAQSTQTSIQSTAEKKVQTVTKPVAQSETKTSEPKPVTQNVATTTSPTSPAQAKPKTITPNTAAKTPEASSTTTTKPKELSTQSTQATAQKKAETVAQPLPQIETKAPETKVETSNTSINTSTSATSSQSTEAPKTTTPVNTPKKAVPSSTQAKETTKSSETPLTENETVEDSINSVALSQLGETAASFQELINYQDEPAETHTSKTEQPEAWWFDFSDESNISREHSSYAEHIKSSALPASDHNSKKNINALDTSDNITPRTSQPIDAAWEKSSGTEDAPTQEDTDDSSSNDDEAYEPASSFKKPQPSEDPVIITYGADSKAESQSSIASSDDDEEMIDDEDTPSPYTPSKPKHPAPRKDTDYEVPVTYAHDSTSTEDLVSSSPEETEEIKAEKLGEDRATFDRIAEGNDDSVDFDDVLLSLAAEDEVAPFARDPNDISYVDYGDEEQAVMETQYIDNTANTNSASSRNH